MFYALNLFNVEDYATYRKYLTTAGPIVQELGGDLVVMGKKTEEVPVVLPRHDRGRRAAVADHRHVQDRGRRPPLLAPPPQLRQQAPA